MDDERDEIPMLSQALPSLSDEFENCMGDRLSLWSKSASDVGTSFQEDRNLGFTGPLRSERRTTLVQMSGPLYIGSKTKESYDNGPDALRHQERFQLTDKYSTYDGAAKNGGMNNGIAEKNERLLKSGQLGMCNDPYCTTCPSSYHYNAGQLKFRSSSDTLVAKVVS